MIQGSNEWKIARLGKVTASRISDVMARGQGGKPSTTRSNYMAELVAERLTGEAATSFNSAAMQHGTETEGQARANYIWQTGNDVSEVGFIPHPSIAMAGASPDGLIGVDRGIEIKCPNTATHISTLRGSAIKRDYILQMQWGMSCTMREAWDFISFDPRLPDEIRMHIRTVYADYALINEIETEVKAFLSEIEEIVAELRQKYIKEA